MSSQAINQSPSIHVMHLITGLQVGGAEMMLYKLLSARTGTVDHSVVSLSGPGALSSRIQELGIKVYHLKLHPRLPNPLRLLHLRGLTRSIHPHVIQGWMPHGNLMAGLAGYFSSERVPVLWNIRMSLTDLHKERWGTIVVIRLGARFSRNPRVIVYNSRIGAEQHEAIGYDSGKRRIIANGFDVETFRPDERARAKVRQKLGLDETNLLIGLIARYHPMKNHTGFLRAAALVAASHPSARFVLAGKGIGPDQPELARAINRTELQGKVFLLGERTDTAQINASLDIACSASTWGEGFSNSLGEAMACGVPCVTTDIGDSAYLVASSGICVPPDNPTILAEALEKLIQGGPAGRRELGRAARSRIEKEFSLPVIVRQYEEMYLHAAMNSR